MNRPRDEKTGRFVQYLPEPRVKKPKSRDTRPRNALGRFLPMNIPTAPSPLNELVQRFESIERGLSDIKTVEGGQPFEIEPLPEPIFSPGSRLVPVKALGPAIDKMRHRMMLIPDGTTPEQIDEMWEIRNRYLTMAGQSRNLGPGGAMTGAADPTQSLIDTLVKHRNITQDEAVRLFPNVAMKLKHATNARERGEIITGEKYPEGVESIEEYY